MPRAVPPRNQCLHMSDQTLSYRLDHPKCTSANPFPQTTSLRQPVSKNQSSGMPGPLHMAGTRYPRLQGPRGTHFHP